MSLRLARLQAILKGNDQTVKVKLETVESPDGNDNATWVALTENGGTESKSQLLVSGDVDDTTPSAYDIGLDDPTTEVNNDRTHKVQLGGKVRLSAMKIGAGNEIAMDIKIPVPVKKTVHINAVIFSDAEGVNVANDVRLANERLAQVGVKVVLDSTTEKSLPFYVTGTGLQIEDTIIQSSIADGRTRALVTKCGTTSIEDIHVFYVHGIKNSGGTLVQGATFSETLSANYPGMANNCFIQDSHAAFKTLAHELVHLLTGHDATIGEGHWGTDYGKGFMGGARTRDNLMRKDPHSSGDSDSIVQSKRLYPEQQELIWKHRSAQ